MPYNAINISFRCKMQKKNLDYGKLNKLSNQM